MDVKSYKRHIFHLPVQLNTSNTHSNNMLRNICAIFIIFLVILSISECCLITNCPRGGKRSGHFHHEANIKQCVSCGPGHTGQCFGSKICCGPFGCLIGTAETVRCQRDGFFQESEPCVAGISYCRKNSGRCAADGVCCTQESCYVDKSCSLEEKQFRAQELESLYNIFPFPNQPDYGN